MRAYLDVQSSLGKRRIFLELFPDKAPLACSNFVGLCSNPDKGYKNSKIHRIVAPEFIVQGGDVGWSTFEYGDFNVESPGWCDLSEGGYLCMASNEQGKNKCEWFITLEAYPHLSQTNTVFGRLLEPGALDYLRSLGSLEVDEQYRPLEDVTVVKCGEMRWQEDQVRERSVSRERQSRDRSQSPSRRSRRHRPRSRDDRSSRRKDRKRRTPVKYMDNDEHNMEVRRWEDRHNRRPRSRSPSEKLSSQRMREDISRHITEGNREKPPREHQPPTKTKKHKDEDFENKGVVRKGRGVPKYGGGSDSSFGGRLGRPM